MKRVGRVKSWYRLIEKRRWGALDQLMYSWVARPVKCVFGSLSYVLTLCDLIGEVDGWVYVV